MPWTLYGYILKDLLRLFLMTTAVLVLVISFAASVEHLNAGLLDAWTLVKFIFHSVPTMLIFVAPFAATFASTLVFCRLAADNEITACAAGGMSYRSILLPVFLMGLTLALLLYYLSNWVVPYFYRQTEQMVQRDVTQMLVSQIKAGRPVRIPGRQGYVLYADDADVSDLSIPSDESGVAPHKLISLVGVVLGRYEQSDLREYSTAEQADLYLYRHDQRTLASLRLRDGMVYDPMGGAYRMMAGGGESRAVEIESPFKNQLRFLDWRQLIRLRHEPGRYRHVRRSKLKLAADMATKLLLDDMQHQLDPLRGRGRVTLTGRADQRFVVTSPKVTQHRSNLRLSADGEQLVSVQQFDEHMLAKRYEAPEGELKVKASGKADEPEIELTLTNPTVRVVGSGSTQKKVHTFGRARWPTDVMGPLMAFPSRQLILQLTDDMLNVPRIRRDAEVLVSQIKKLHRKIVAQHWERSALAVSNLLVMLLGAVLSIKMRGTMPLVVYFWSFLLASLAVFATRGGENVASDPEYPAIMALLIVLSGNIILVVAITAIYMRLARN